jgi:cytochrome c
MAKAVLLLRIGGHRWYVPAAIVGASRMIRFAFFPVLLLAFPGTAPAADVAAGQAAFARCKICHSVQAGAPSPVGPNLHGVFGRKAGTLEGYSYSEAMKNSGIVWDDETLTKYLRDPRGTMPGNKMAFPGIKSDDEVPNLLAYLHQATQ